MTAKNGLSWRQIKIRHALLAHCKRQNRLTTKDTKEHKGKDRTAKAGGGRLGMFLLSPLDLGMNGGAPHRVICDRLIW
jgi:hypothetical protein